MKSLFVRNSFIGYQLFTLVIISCALMFADQRFDYLSQVRYAASYVVRPIQWLAGVPQSFSDSVQDSLKSRADLIEENDNLQDQLLMQQYQLQQLAYLTAENQRLSELLNASSIVEERVVRAQVVGRAPDPFDRRIMINKGKNEGVFLGQPVLDAHGLMGQVVEIEPYRSWVLLISDPQHSTPVQVTRNGVITVASGNQENSGEMELSNLPVTADIQVGDILETSGLGQRFPVGYPVGTITSVEHDPGQSFAIVKAAPLAMLDRSRNVLLVF